MLFVWSSLKITDCNIQGGFSERQTRFKKRPDYTHSYSVTHIYTEQALCLCLDLVYS